MKARHDSILAVGSPSMVGELHRSLQARTSSAAFCSSTHVRRSQPESTGGLADRGCAIPGHGPVRCHRAFAFFRELDLRRLRQTQGELDAIRAMDWQNFELLVSEGFRRLGYTVDNQGWYFPNSRVHITAAERRRADARRLPGLAGLAGGLPPVRELYKTLNSEHADGALLVTSGSFTLDAEVFARDKPIGLIDGQALLELVADRQAGRRRRRG